MNEPDRKPAAAVGSTAQAPRASLGSLQVRLADGRRRPRPVDYESRRLPAITAPGASRWNRPAPEGAQRPSTRRFASHAGSWPRAPVPFGQREESPECGFVSRARPPRGSPSDHRDDPGGTSVEILRHSDPRPPSSRRSTPARCPGWEPGPFQQSSASSSRSVARSAASARLAGAGDRALWQWDRLEALISPHPWPAMALHELRRRGTARRSAPCPHGVAGRGLPCTWRTGRDRG